eukprot:gb/GECG01007484.1/.p1 GENE.gb/GECG01007484.1/~~gb/GECG01007484.1/.p1  ORF type:complete len:115 (+),score=14.38 gb/GECG01007484.1/:1-345(+)
MLDEGLAFGIRRAQALKVCENGGILGYSLRIAYIGGNRGKIPEGRLSYYYGILLAGPQCGAPADVSTSGTSRRKRRNERITHDKAASDGGKENTTTPTTRTNDDKFFDTGKIEI